MVPAGSNRDGFKAQEESDGRTWSNGRASFSCLNTGLLPVPPSAHGRHWCRLVTTGQADGVTKGHHARPVRTNAR